MKTRGLRCGVSALVAPCGVSKGGLRWAGGGSHRLAVPGREQLSPRLRVDWEWRDPHSQQTFGRWTLLDAAPSAGGLIEVRTYGAIGPGV